MAFFLREHKHAEPITVIVIAQQRVIAARYLVWEESTEAPSHTWLWNELGFLRRERAWAAIPDVQTK